MYGLCVKIYSNLSDTIDESDPLSQTPFSDDSNVNIPPRANVDTTIDGNGRRLLSLCKSTSHIIANGRLHNDVPGGFTYSSIRGNSTVDYLLLKVEDIHVLNNFKVLDRNEFSDHFVKMKNRKCKNNS